MTGLMTDSTAIPSAEGSEDHFGSPDAPLTFSFDLPEEEEWVPPIPEGTFLCYISDINPGKSRKGNPMIVVEWVVAEGELEGTASPGKTYVTLTQSAMFKVREFCEATGLGHGGQSVEFTKDQALNRLALVEFVHNEVEFEDDDGNVQTRTYVNPINIFPPPAGAGAEYQPTAEGIPA